METRVVPHKHEMQHRKHGSYLQGMETNIPSFTFERDIDMCTDPTYKEWKLLSQGIFQLSPSTHGSYLQGMETTKRRVKLQVKIQLHGSYLQGMETYFSQLLLLNLLKARILPTRNGNECLRFIGFHDSRCTDPTYKEWKL